MANRHLSRSIALQSLFEWDFNNLDAKSLDSISKENVKEFGPGEGDSSYLNELLANIIEKKDLIDDVINKAAPEWPIDKISVVDRNVLRIGLCELLFSDKKEVPAKVAINEAIELAKTYGGENSGKFINGVLGTVYREMGEPGKEDVSKFKETDITKMPKEFLGGAVVYKKNGNNMELAFVHDVFGFWTLSKGRLEECEGKEEGTIREIKEEMGIDIDIVCKIGENEYTASDPEKGKIRKHVYYFLGRAKTFDITLTSGGGLDDAKWFPIEDIEDLKIYDDILPIITDGIKFIQKKNE